jgi:hypothetical protein
MAVGRALIGRLVIRAETVCSQPRQQAGDGGRAAAERSANEKQLYSSFLT